MDRVRFQLVLALGLGAAAPVFGWGSYGHQQINFAAVHLLQESGSDLGKCLARNLKYLQRLAITPDYDWKVVGQEPPDPALRHQRALNDLYEHPLHFFEADAFVVGSWRLANFEGEYQSVLPDLKSALSENADQVEKIDPDKKIANKASPTDADVATHGSAPWRILQLHRLANTELKKAQSQADLVKALFYFGVDGHYKGDMSQPFHATLDYDGKSVGAHGIHHAFEEGILEAAAAQNKVTRGKDELWTSFVATDKAVMETARKKFPADNATLTQDKVVAAVFELVESSGSYIAPIEEQYRASVKAVDDGTHRVLKDPGASKVLFAKYKDQKLSSGPHAGKTVLGAAEELMGSSAALLAVEWNSNYEEAAAANPALARVVKACAGSPEITFSLADAINWYPKPEYLPKDAQRSGHRSNHAGGPHDHTHPTGGIGSGAATPGPGPTHPKPPVKKRGAQVPPV